MVRSILDKKIAYAIKSNDLKENEIFIDGNIGRVSKLEKSKRFKMVGIDVILEGSDRGIYVSTKKLLKFVNSADDMPDGAISLIIAQAAFKIKSEGRESKSFEEKMATEFMAYKYAYLKCAEMYATPDKSIDLMNHTVSYIMSFIAVNMSNSVKEMLLLSIADAAALIVDMGLDADDMMDLINDGWDYEIQNGITLMDAKRQGLVTRSKINNLVDFAYEFDEAVTSGETDNIDKILAKLNIK